MTAWENQIRNEYLLESTKDVTLQSSAQYAKFLNKLKEGINSTSTPSHNTSYDQHKLRTSITRSTSTPIMSNQESQWSKWSSSFSKKSTPPKHCSLKRESDKPARRSQRAAVLYKNTIFSRSTEQISSLLRRSQVLLHLSRIRKNDQRTSGHATKRSGLLSNNKKKTT